MASRALLFLLVCIMALSLTSINCNGLRTKSKLKNVFSLFKTKKYDIICVQETFWNDSFVTNFVKHQWDGDILYSNFNTNRKGVAILFRKNAGINILSFNEIIKGRILEVEIEIDDETFNIYNVYAPNGFKERGVFFDEFNNVVHKKTNNNCIVAGDFNCVTEPIDKSNFMYADTSRAHFVKMVKHNDLNDVWRDHHPRDREFTWRRVRHNKLIQSRIDKVLICNPLKHYVIDSSIVPFSMSDHDIVHTRLDLSRVTRGQGVWKFNKQLLKNIDYCNEIRTCITNSKHNVMYKEDLLQWYEELKANLKSISIIHAKRAAKAKNKEKRRLTKCIKNEYRKAAKYRDYDLSLCKKLEQDFHIIEAEECEGNIIRSKIKHIEGSEKSTKYFFNLEKSRNKKKDIKRLQCEDGSLATNSPDIVREGFNFYSKLFKDEECDDRVQDAFVNNIDVCLKNDDVNICANPISFQCLIKALKGMEANKSPGSDGLTREFYIFFLDELGPILLDVANCIHASGRLPLSMSRGIVTLVPKKGDITLLKNWRPITLLNIDYKLIAKALAANLTKVIKNIISNDQTCCVPGRDIADNVLAMRDLVDYIDENKLPGYLVKIDQQKAFDRVNHKYLIKVLEKFGFPDYFVKWIKIIYSEAKSCVKINDFLSDDFSIARGIRQGCPLSAMLYILTAEPMRNAIVKCPDVNGFVVDGTRALLFQHADDSTAIVSNLESIDAIFGIFDTYNNASGSKVNIEKSEILPLGTAATNPPTNLAVKVISDCVEVLGVYIGKNKKLCQSNNWDSRIDRCIKLLNTWKGRSLSVKGKVLVANTLIISRIVYVLNLTHIANDDANKLKKAIVDFIWSGKRHKIKYEVLISSVENGGMGLLDIDRMKCSLRSKYIRKIFDVEEPLNPVAKAMIVYNLAKYKNMKLGKDVFRIIISKNHAKRLPQFYEEMLLAWKKISNEFYVIPRNANELLNQPLFDNPFIVDDLDNSIFLRECVENGILRIRDLIFVTSPGFRPIDEVFSPLKTKVKGERLEELYFKLFWSIPQNWRIKIVKKALIDLDDPPSIYIQPVGVDDPIDICSTSTRDINRLLRKQDSFNLLPAGLVYWRDYFNDDNLCIPFDLCFGGLKENHQAEIDYFIAHNVLYTNDKLTRMGLEDDPLCTYCKVYVENIDHLFTGCYEVRQLYILVWNICEKIIGKKITCDDFTFMAIFGYKNIKFMKTFRLVNLLLCIYRYSVWSGRKWTRKGQKISLKFIFKAYVKQRLDIEFKKYLWEDSLNNFFDIFGINNVLIISEANGYKCTL